MHVWNWLANNSAVLQAIGAFATLPLLAFAGWFAKAAAKAAEDQARAAKAQVDAADSASRLSEQQLQAALESAAAEKEHSRLLRQQMLATLYPLVSFKWRQIEDEGLTGFLINESLQALAIDIEIEWVCEENQIIVLEVNTLGPKAETKLIGMKRQDITKRGVLKATYESLDGRSFITEVRVRIADVVQMNSEIPDRHTHK